MSEWRKEFSPDLGPSVTETGPWSCAETGQHWAAILRVTNTKVNLHQEPPIPLDEVLVECQSCHASWWFARIVAQDAEPTTSTSASPASVQSVAGAGDAL